MRNKRFELHDGLGYFRKYKTRRAALQAIKDLGKPISKYWIIIDKEDNSRSFVELGNPS